MINTNLDYYSILFAKQLSGGGSGGSSNFDGQLVVSGDSVDGYTVSITIPDGITEIGDNAFKNLTGLTTVTISETVTEIGQSAFEGCTWLETIYCNPTIPPTIDTDTFKDIPNDCVIYVSDDSYNAYATAWSSVVDNLMPISGGEEKTIDFTPIISVSDAIAKPAIDLQCKITAVQEGSGDPSPTNIRPITGFTGLSVFRGSSVSVENKEIVISAVQSGEGNPSPTNIRPISAGLTIEMDDHTTLEVYGGTLNPYESKITITKVAKKISDIPTENWRYSNNSGDWNSYLFFANLTERKRITTSICSAYKFVTSTEANVPADAYILPTWNTWFYVRDDSLTSITDFLTARGNERIVIELATPQEITLSATELARALTALGITEIPVTWQTEAGTVYGGVVDITTGVLTVTHAIVTLTKDSTWQKGGSQTAGGFNRFYSSPVPNMKGGSGMLDGMCDKLPIGKISSLIPCVVLGYSNNNYIQVLSTANDVEDFKAELENTYGNALSVVYPLDTLLTYTLTPQTVALLAGNNTLWNTAGDTKLTYLAKKG